MISLPENKNMRPVITWRWGVETLGKVAHAGFEGQAETVCDAQAGGPVYHPVWFDFRCQACEEYTRGLLERYPSPFPEGVFPSKFDIQAVPFQEGFQAFLLVEARGRLFDLLPIQEVPPMKTYRDALELAMVVAWQNIDSLSKELGCPIGPLT